MKKKSLFSFIAIFALAMGFLYIEGNKPAQATVSPTVSQGANLPGLLYQAGATDAKGIFEVANASGAVKTKTAVQKQRAFQTIENAVANFRQQNPSGSNHDLYRAVEIALAKDKLLTYHVDIPREKPKPVAKKTEPKKQYAQVVRYKVNKPKSFNAKFYAAVGGSPLDSYQIYSAIDKAGLLSPEGKKERKQVTSIIKKAITKEQRELKKELSGGTVQKILTELKAGGYLTKGAKKKKRNTGTRYGSKPPSAR